MSIKYTLKKIAEIAKYYKLDKPYIVGGLPRDIYIKGEIKTKDIDITTNSPDVLRLGVLTADFFNVPFELSDDGHLTVFMDGFDLDFSSNFISNAVKKYLNEKDSKYQEAFSRDFTINTLHQDLETEKFYDPTGQSVEDIRNKIIKTPVPVEITLMDDPRRAYRAINLAVRYRFEIHPDIIDFVIKNHDIFAGETMGSQSAGVKDKYIITKVNNSLSHDADRTINLLKKMDLFRSVPLSGKFKDILVEKRLLNEYLKSEDFKKIASDNLEAKNWDEYISQGSAYQAIMNWWKSNYSKFPEYNSPEYYSWTDWYMDHLRGDWGGSHKDPEETLKIMKEEANHSPVPTANSDKRQGPKEWLSNLLRKKEKESYQKPAKYTISENYLEKVSRNPSANLINIKPELKSFIKILGETAEKLGAEKPHINSGHRTLKQQASAMFENWKNNGGMKNGRDYLVSIYNDNLADDLATVFEENYNKKNQAISQGAEILSKYPIPYHGHTSSPAGSIDLKPTQKLEDVLTEIKNSGRFDLNILDERRSANHWHISVKMDRGYQNKIAKYIK